MAQREIKQQLRQLFNGLILQGMEHGVMIAQCDERHAEDEQYKMSPRESDSMKDLSPRRVSRETVQAECGGEADRDVDLRMKRHICGCHQDGFAGLRMAQREKDAAPGELPQREDEEDACGGLPHPGKRQGCAAAVAQAERAAAEQCQHLCVFDGAVFHICPVRQYKRKRENQKRIQQEQPPCAAKMRGKHGTSQLSNEYKRKYKNICN